MKDESRARETLAERVASRLASARPAVVEPAPAPAPVAQPVPAEPEPVASGTPILDISTSRLAAAGFVTPNAPPSRLSQELRVIKRQLLAEAFPHGGRSGGQGHVIMVTSSMPGEGKTFCSVNLALSLSFERDIRVLLVDGDSYHHSAGDLLGAGSHKGLVDLLIEPGVKTRDVLLRTSIPNLTFLPAGRVHPHTTELFSSKQMAQLVRELSERYPDRVILIDTPPVLASTEASVLAPLVGQAIVVVEKNRTSKLGLERTLTLLEGCPNVSCILNMASDDIGIPMHEYYDYGQA
ncbi:MAG: AAA family ATPase [Rhodospirillaceae bacterium]|nr:AAA family ATPase [Rhodospirillales bacterium]